MNGAGNDFIVIDNRFYHFSDEELATIARAFCPRRVGIGADGVLALSRPQSKDAHFRMRYLNADGSVATMCGNGARCLARFARLGGITAEPLVFETDAGMLRASISDPSMPEVELTMTDPKNWSRVEGISAAEVETYYVWTGTEHIVQFVDDLEGVDVSEAGRAIRRHELLAPRGANVNFVETSNPETIRIRTYEKGVEAETAACGTGAVAAAVAAYRTGRAPSGAMNVDASGGRLHVAFDENTDGEIHNVRLSGSAEIVFRGTFEWD